MDIKEKKSERLFDFDVNVRFPYILTLFYECEELYISG